MPSINFHGVQLLFIAHGLRDKAQAATKERGEMALPPEALASILMAAASTEAFINEFPEHIRISQMSLAVETQDAVTPAMAGCADVIGELEEAKGSVTLKYQFAARMLSGAPFPKGKHPFQQFDLLMQVRNEIVHLKPVWSGKVGRLAKIVDALAQQGHAIAPQTSLLPPLDSLTDCRASAWACSAARGIILGILAMTPDGEPGIDPFAAIKRQLLEHFPYSM